MSHSHIFLLKYDGKLMTSTTGVLLLNLGTPEAPTPKAIRCFLREFLSDRRVNNMPRFLWYPILYGFILTFRPRKLEPKYREIWGDCESPIKEVGFKLRDALSQALRNHSTELAPVVALAMTYGSPSIKETLEQYCKSVEQLIILPMFPQYASSSTAAVYDSINRTFSKLSYIPKLHFISDYHDHPLYIKALVNSIRSHWKITGRQGRLLFSLHGVPISHIKKGDPYQKQCENTCTLVAAQLNLDKSQWTLGYQSRPGKGKWLEPYTEELLHDWGTTGLAAVDVICPGFSADCLETLDEVAVQYRQLFENAGGKDFQYIPALNNTPEHIQLLAALCNEQMKEVQ